MSSSNSGNAIVGIIAVIVVGIAAWFLISSLVNSGENNKTDDNKTNNEMSINSVTSDIASNGVGGTCSYTDKKNEYLSVKTVQKTGTTNFVNLAKEVLKSDKCTSFQYSLAIDVKDARGNASEQPILVFAVNQDNKEKFETYDWNNLIGEKIGSQLQSDNILTKIRTDIKDVSLDNVVYNGESANLK